MPNIKQIQLPNENIYDILDASALHTSELKSTTKGTVAASDKGNTANKEYAVGYDKNGKLSVNVPWTDNNTTYTGSDGVTLTGTNFTNSGVRSISTGSSNGNISVNTNGTTADVPVKGLKSAAYKDVTNTYSSTGTDPVSGTAVASALTSLAPMVYKGTLGTSGTITTLPTAAAGNKGYVYNVITAGTYASQTAKVGDMFISNGSNWVLVPSGDDASGTVTSIATGAGLTGGTITSSGTIKANLKSETASTLDSAAMGSTSNKQYAVGVDKSGYLSVNIPWTDTNTKVTSVGNHYAPTEDSSAQLSVDASGGSAATWNSTQLVTGVDIKRDAKGHVTGIAVDSIKMPANPNTDNDTKVTQTATSTSADYEVLFSETADNTTRTEGARKNNNLKFNPSTGNLQATQLNGVTIGSSPKFTDTTYGAGTGISLSGTTFSNSGVRSISTGSTNGTISVNTNGTSADVAVKGLGSAAYTASTAYASSSHNQSADTILGGYLNIQPENSPTIIPFMNNDIAFLSKRGGSYSISYDGTIQTINLDGCFDGTPSYGYGIGNSGDYTNIVIELTLHKTFTWGNTFYVDFGSSSWRAKGIKVEVMNTNYSGDTWTQKLNITNNALGHISCSVAHQPVGASNTGGGLNKIRITFTSFNNSIFRIAQLGLYNYSSAGMSETYLNKGGGAVYGTVYPYSNNGADLGGSSNYWNNAYITKINGVSVGSSPKFTDTTYSNKNAASGGTDVSLVTTGEKYTWNNKSNLTIGTTATTAAAGNHTHSYVPLDGGTMTGQLKTSFKSSVAMGTYQATATTIPNLCDELRYSSGVAGSASITTAYTLSGSGVTIGTGWYNFLWIPHRSGGVNGAASGDNCNYGSLYLSGMTMSGCYMIRYSSSAITEVKNLYADTNTTYTASTTSIGSASAGTAIPADDITAWSAGTATSASVSLGVLTITNGTAPSLSYTAKSIPNITVSSKTVVTGITADS